MNQAWAQRDALRVFRLILLIKLGFNAAGLVIALSLAGPAGLWLLLRAAPTLLLVLLAFLPWAERALGRWYLAVILGLDVLVESLESAALYFNMQGFWPQAGSAPAAMSALQLAPMQPFFLLIPVVLLAWGYGRRGALWGSTWATALHLGIGLGALRQELFTRPFVLSVLFPIVLLYVVPFIVSELARRERAQHAELEDAYERLRRHAATVEQLAVSRERNRLARDLHDTLAHSLSAIVVQLEALRTLLAHDPPAAEQTVTDLAVLARRGLAESRRAIQALRSNPVETMGLEGALREQLLAFEARTGVALEMIVTGQDADLTLEEALALYRIAEEALLNVERHAGARRVSAQLVHGSDCVRLGIVDDGSGFDPDSVEADRYDLTGMRERAALVGATLEVTSGPGRGTEVWCSLPR